MCALALAQVQTTTGITGTVTDGSGAVLPGVEVVVTDQDTGTVRRAITNDSGLYVIQSLKPGTYSISASLAGFKTAVVKDRQVQVTIPAQVNLVMQVGELSETVTVSGVGEEMVNKTTAQLATTISENLVKNLPVETRNYFDLMSLAPNTSPEYLSVSNMSFGQHSMRRVNAAGSFESSGVFAAGERDSSSYVSIDGASPQIANYNQTVTIQSSSTIKELRLETASANAEFGNGSNAVNVITKSGTNDFHGEVFWQHRNDNIDAVGYFTNLAGRQLPEYKRNKFGATMGGPIIKNKLLFFANYEGSRLRQAVQGNTRVPTALERSGNFSQTQLFASPGVLAPPREIYNPFSYDPATGLRSAFPNKTIPTSLLDPGMQVAFKYTALPNTIIDGIPQYTGLNRTDLDENQYTARIDWQKSDKDPGLRAIFVGRERGFQLGTPSSPSGREHAGFLEDDSGQLEPGDQFDQAQRSLSFVRASEVGHRSAHHGCSGCHGRDGIGKRVQTWRLAGPLCYRFYRSIVRAFRLGSDPEYLPGQGRFQLYDGPALLQGRRPPDRPAPVLPDPVD